jgi:hypothetical protein
VGLGLLGSKLLDSELMDMKPISQAGAKNNDEEF